MFSAALHGSRGLLHFLITPCKSPSNCGHFNRTVQQQQQQQQQQRAGRGATGAGLGLGLGLGLGRTDPGYPSILTPEGTMPFPGFPPYVIAKALNTRLKALGPHLMQLRTCGAAPGTNCTMASCPSSCQVYLRARPDASMGVAQGDTDPSKKLKAVRPHLHPNRLLGVAALPQPATLNSSGAAVQRHSSGAACVVWRAHVRVWFGAGVCRARARLGWASLRRPGVCRPACPW